MKTLIVGISDLAVGKNDTTLQTNGLGSCVGIVLFDKYSNIGGLLHILLPECTKENEENKAKYADTGIPLLVETMLLIGANKRYLRAAIYGGADMFQSFSRTSTLSIGKRNIEATKRLLKEYNIPIMNSDVGGNQGRTVIFNCETGEITIKSLGKTVREFKF